MTKQEFYDLLDKWTRTPEYKEYEELCFDCDTLSKQLKNEKQIFIAFAKAIDNEYGKQLANEPKFLELIRNGANY